MQDARALAFVEQARVVTGLPIETWTADSFGDSPAMADELAALVASGRKRATAGLLDAYAAGGVDLPRSGDCEVVLDGSGEPVCLIRLTDVRVRRFRDVDAAFAFDEGEGDRSLAFWREAHRNFFTRGGYAFDDESLVVCVRFALLYRPAHERGGDPPPDHPA